MQHFIPIKVHYVFPLLRVASCLSSFIRYCMFFVQRLCGSAQYVGTTALVELSVPDSRKHSVVLGWAAQRGSRLLSWGFSPLQTHQRERERETSGRDRGWRSLQHWELQTTRWQCITSSARATAAWRDQYHYWCWENISLRRVIVRPRVTDQVRRSTRCMLNLATLIKGVWIRQAVFKQEGRWQSTESQEIS